jgi:hypothetical protein
VLVVVDVRGAMKRAPAGATVAFVKRCILVVENKRRVI